MRGGDWRFGSGAHKRQPTDETFQGGANAACESACVWLSPQSAWIGSGGRRSARGTVSGATCCDHRSGLRRPIGASNPNRHRVSSPNNRELRHPENRRKYLSYRLLRG